MFASLESRTDYLKSRLVLLRPVFFILLMHIEIKGPKLQRTSTREVILYEVLINFRTILGIDHGAIMKVFNQYNILSKYFTAFNFAGFNLNATPKEREQLPIEFKNLFLFYKTYDNTHYCQNLIYLIVVISNTYTQTTYPI